MTPPPDTQPIGGQAVPGGTTRRMGAGPGPGGGQASTGGDETAGSSGATREGVTTTSGAAGATVLSGPTAEASLIGAMVDGGPAATDGDVEGGGAPQEGAVATCATGDLARFRVMFDVASWGRYWDAVRAGVLRRDELLGVQFLLWRTGARDADSPYLPRRSDCLVSVAFGFQSVDRSGLQQEPVPDASPPEGFEERLAHYPPGVVAWGSPNRDAFGFPTVDLRFWVKTRSSPEWSEAARFTPVEAVVTLHLRQGSSGVGSLLRTPADLEFGFTYVGFDHAESWPLQPFSDEQLLRHATPIHSGRLRLLPGPGDIEARLV